MSMQELSDFFDKEDSPERRLQRAKESLYNPEVQILVNKKSLLGALAKYAVFRSPYIPAPNLEMVLQQFDFHVSDYFPDEADEESFGYRTFNILDLEDFIKVHVRMIPEAMQWAKPKNKQDDGDESNPDNKYVSISPMCNCVAQDLYINYCFFSAPQFLPKPQAE